MKFKKVDIHKVVEDAPIELHEKETQWEKN